MHLAASKYKAGVAAALPDRPIDFNLLPSMPQKGSGSVAFLSATIQQIQELPLSAFSDCIRKLNGIK